jgi:hypothetical protein
MDSSFAEQLKHIAEDNWLTSIKTYVPSAWIGHAPFLRYLIRDLQPKIFVELGTHNGFSYFVGCQTIQELNLSAKAYAVDHWQGDQHAGHFDESVYESVVELNAQYQNFSNLLKMSFLEARSLVSEPIDLLHIDGLHTYEAVKEDFKTWLPKMSKNGVIILHDIHVRHADFGVYKLWEEIKSQYSTLEFTGSYGLGVVFINGEAHSLYKLRQISDAGLLMQIQGVFGGLSDGVIQHFRLIEANRFAQVIANERITCDETNIRLSLERDTLRRELDTLINSKSWRVTKPMRKIFSWSHRIG